MRYAGFKPTSAIAGKPESLAIKLLLMMDKKGGKHVQWVVVGVDGRPC